MEGETTASSLTRTLGTSIRPIALGPSLLGYMDNQNYGEFVQRWRRLKAP